MEWLIKNVICAIVILLVWILSYGTYAWIFDGLSANLNYATICAWWTVVYISSQCRAYNCINVKTLSITLIMAFFTSLIASDFLYHEIAGASLLQRCIISLSQAIFIISPLLFDYSIRQIIEKFSNQGAP